MSVITSEKVDALKKAIASGIFEVEYSDKRVKYRSLKDMMIALQYAKNELNGTKAGKSIRLYDRYDKGL